MKRIYLIGMGAGAVGHLTLQAVDAMRAVDVFFLLEKDGAGKDELARLRREFLDAVLPDGGYRLVAATSPERTMAEPTYDAGIEAWRQSRAGVIAALIEAELAPGEVGGFLVWGDPCLYDGMIQTLHELGAAGVAVDFEVIPGITSIQALTAAHRIPLNRVGEPITITTARQLKAMEPTTVTNAVVMLDGQAAFAALADTDLEIYWGAYLGTADVLTVSGPLRDKADEIAETINRARDAKGWLMDTYILRRP